MKKTFLITGFEPFGGDATNNSWEIAQEVCKKWAEEGNPIVQVVCERLPVSWSKTKGSLEEAVTKHNPQYLLSLGLASEIPCLRFEQIARNEAIAVTDNDSKTFAKNQKTTVALAAKKPIVIPSTLPQEWLMTEFPADITTSDNAGGYLCNYVFFQNMINFPQIETKGFIHVCNAFNIEATKRAINILFQMIQYTTQEEKVAV